jgi:hypothetical protein
MSLKHVAPTTLFLLLYTYMHAMLKHDSYLCCIPSVFTLLILVDGLAMGRHAWTCNLLSSPSLPY